MRAALHVGRGAVAPWPWKSGTARALFRAAALWLAVGACLCPSAAAAPLRIAVAASFAEPLRTLGDRFSAATSQPLALVTGATGKLAAQIQNGAPYEVLVAADAETPARLEAAGLAVAGTRVTYAIGKLVLFSTLPGYVDSEGAVLQRGTYRHLAVANARLAPYGAAALQVLRSLQLLSTVEPRLVVAESIAQTYQFVTSGGAELGFVALSLLVSDSGRCPGSCWLVPQGLYAPLRQDAVVLARGRAVPAATAFVEFLRSPSSREFIAAHGFELPPAAPPAMPARSE